MKLEVVTMTPEWASRILAKQNTKNRHMRPGRVQKYSHAIKSGEWKLTQQGIAIGSDGVLLDGQHRLAAIVEAGVPVQIAMATDCDPSIFTVIDTGAGRTASDALYLAGAVHTVAASAGLKAYMMCKRHPDKVWTGVALIPTHAEIVDAYNDRQEDIDWASALGNNSYAGYRHLNRAAVTALSLLALDAHWDGETIETFCSKLRNGDGLMADCPILRLRAALANGLLTSKSRHTSLIQSHLACLIKTFNYWNQGVSMRLFKAPQCPPIPAVTSPNF